MEEEEMEMEEERGGNRTRRRGGDGGGGRRRTTESVREKIKNLVAPHVESYDVFIKGGLQQVVAAQKPVRCRTKLRDGSRVELEVQLGEVQLRQPSGFGEYPRECREAKKTYSTPAFVNVSFFLRTAPRAGAWGRWECVYERMRPLGELPIMVCSAICKLSTMNAEELTQKPCEHEREVGGYFVVNGVEKVVRMLVQTRRHYPLALRRPAYAQKRRGFTEFCVSMRSIDWKSGCNAHTVRVHYVDDGSASVAIRIGKIEYFVPLGVLLRALSDDSEKTLFDMLAGRAAAAAAAADGTGEQASSDNTERSSFMSLRADLILERTARLGIRDKNSALQYLGRHFRQELGFAPTDDDGDDELVRDTKSDEEVGLCLLEESIFRHLQDNEQKLSLLVLMVRKLWMVVRGDCCEDNADTLDSQELLLPGQLLGMIAFDRLEIWLKNIARQVVQTWTKRGAQRLRTFGSTEHLRIVLDAVRCDVGPKIEYMLATGNVMPGSNVGVGQSRGLSVHAEKLNYLRYISHFRSVHRGAYFATMRTATVRKLMPESFGFMCPVHTPDGSPCGLLLHLSHMCRVVTEDASPQLMSYLLQSGMQRVEDSSEVSPAFLYDESYVHVIVDGIIVGYVPRSIAAELAANMRREKRTLLSVPCASTKLENDDAHTSRFDTALDRDRNQKEDADTCTPGIPWHTEVAFLPPSRGGPFPGLFIYTQAARMIRPVVPLVDVGGGADKLRGPVIGTGRQRHCRVRVEYIGSLEQLFMDIECERSGVGGLPSLDGRRSAHITHAEVMPTSMLSLVASLTPWSDYNQSPRNMYQCQMAKQTMGTPCHNYKHNMDTKMYRLHTPQRPISRTVNHEAFGVDDFALGTNAVVAVLSYTGYDMEDAMIINKSSMERGFAHGTLYKTSVIELDKDEEQFSNRGGAGNMRFDGRFTSSVVDLDGLPRVGERLRQGDAYCRTVNTIDSRSRDAKLVDEAAEVDSVTIVGDGQKDMENNIRRANIKFRINRNPVIGDKFASRHGQKGVLSQLWPDIDMPYCEATGMRPDIIINPHAFPSRMTIGMLVESIASKAGALEGCYQDCTPFQDATKDDGESGRDGESTGQGGIDDVLGGGVISAYGKQLASHGFNYYGSETMISGVTGEPFKVEIFIGLVYYQRLRHMVSDKYQVRSEGPVDPVTHQPIKGRKAGGGIRFGEMERDALLAHGVSYLVHDRLHACSDYYTTHVCSLCGSIVSTASVKNNTMGAGSGHGERRREGQKVDVQCLSCKTGAGVNLVAVPYVFKYLASELCAMNIRCVLNVDK